MNTLCDAQHGSFHAPWSCTLTDGHYGPHRAEGPTGRLYKQWRDGEPQAWRYTDVHHLEWLYQESA